MGTIHLVYCYIRFCRSAAARHQVVNSSELILNFTINQLRNSGAFILSARNDMLIVSSYAFSVLFVYGLAGNYIKTIEIEGFLRDVTWTPRGNIAYTTYNRKSVVVMSEAGKIIHTSLMTGPQRFSVSTDDIIYMADEIAGVYQSVDDGASWSLIINSTQKWKYWQVIKVSSEHGDDYWTFLTKDFISLMRVYSRNQSIHQGGKIETWKDVNLPIVDGKMVELVDSSVSFDGNSNIFLSDFNNKAVHVWTSRGHYHGQLLSSNHFKHEPCKLAMDLSRRLLLVGTLNSVVDVYSLKYSDI